MSIGVSVSINKCSRLSPSPAKTFVFALHPSGKILVEVLPEPVPNHLGLRLDHLVVCRAAVTLTDIEVAAGRSGEDAHLTFSGPVDLTPPGAVGDLGPLVFRNHALELQEELILCRLAPGRLEEDDFNPAAPQLLHKYGNRLSDGRIAA